MNQILNLSKSKYCSLWQCPKIAWLQKYRPEERVFDELLQQRMTVGSEVGDLWQLRSTKAMSPGST